MGAYVISAASDVGLATAELLRGNGNAVIAGREDLSTQDGVEAKGVVT